MNPEPTIGQSIVQATQFLWKIHKQAQSLLGSLDEIMGEKGWVPTERGRISSELDNGIGDPWAISSAYRLFVPKGQTGGTKRVIGFLIAFVPPECFDYAICFGVASRFDKDVSGADIWNQWEQEGETRILQWLSGQNQGMQMIPKKLLIDAFMPQARTGAGHFLNLESLTGPKVLRASMIDPLIAAERSFDKT